MKASFWHERWAAGRIAFHEGEANGLLARHGSALGDGGRVFVPLCGKTRDMHWLAAKGWHVTGVELSTLAVEQFFEEWEIVPETSRIGEHEVFSGPGIDVFTGDFFALTSEAIGSCDAIYDRAALVALPPEMRGGYAQKLAELTNCAPQLLNTLTYSSEVLQGPPFSVDENEIRAQYNGLYEVAHRETRRMPGGLKGVQEVDEHIWQLIPSRRG